MYIDICVYKTESLCSTPKTQHCKPTIIFIKRITCPSTFRAILLTVGRAWKGTYVLIKLWLIHVDVKRKETYTQVYLWLTPADVWPKLIQDCKAIILPFKMF